MDTKTILGLTVLGAAVSAVGNLLATIIKDFFLARSLEGWKNKRDLRNLYKKYRDPLFLATAELLRRFREIVYESPVDFLDARHLTADWGCRGE